MKALSKIIVSILVLAVSLAALFSCVILLGEYIMPEIDNFFWRIILGVSFIMTVVLDVVITIEYNAIAVLSRSYFGQLAFEGEVFEFKPFIFVWLSIYRNLRNA